MTERKFDTLEREIAGDLEAGIAVDRLTARGSDTGRLLSFSDGVIAIAITLLALNIRIPNLADRATTAEQIASILSLQKSVLVFVQSFLVVGLYWVAHHRMFQFIRGWDLSLLWLNLLFLMSVAFLPVPNAVIVEHSGAQPAVVFFLGSAMLTGLLQLMIWLYATHRHRLISHQVSRHVIRYISLRSLVPVGLFGLGIALSFVSVQLVWVVLLLAAVSSAGLSQFYEWVAHKTARKTTRQDLRSVR
ncbi:MAG: TMEM175 family protein [Dehalococcoidia bacterium]